MDDKRSPDELSELIDAVRPASDDLAQPDFARLAERSRRDAQTRAILQRSQRLDLAIGDALQDLPVPSGAVERLLTTLASAASASSSAVPSPPPPATDARARKVVTSTSAGNDRPDFSSCEAAVKLQRGAHDTPGSAHTPTAEDASPSRRSRFLTGALATTAVVALVGLWALQPAASQFGPHEVLNFLHSDWLFNVDEETLVQTPIDERQPPSRYPMAHAVSAPAKAWRRISDFLGRGGVAYQLRSPAARATLYVVDVEGAQDAPKVVDLPAEPNVEPLNETAGKAMSVWREGKLMYVLVVWGGANEYKSFVTRGGQLAHASNASTGSPFSG